VNGELQEVVVRHDTRPVLREWFTDTENDRGWEMDFDRSGRIGEGQSAGVAWSFEGTHDQVSPEDARWSTFNGIPVTERQVTVRGFTLVDVDFDSDQPRLRLRRYVDWAGLYSQLGLTVNWRVPLP
jgi:hypothetical protein